MISPHRDREYFLNARAEICGKGKNERRKKIGSAILRRRANSGSINIKKRERGGVV